MDKKKYLERISKNLRRYRAIADLSQLELAEKADITRQGYFNIENGKAEPKASTLQKIADALGVKIIELLKEQPQFVSLRFRSKKNMASKDRNIREQTLLEFRKWLDDYKFLEKLLNDHRNFKLSALVGKEDSPEAMADKARAALHLDEREFISDMCGLMESAGIKIWQSNPKTQAFFGFSLSEKDGGPAIGVNVNDDIRVERKIFTVAHELGHILLHPDSYHSEDESEPKDEEKQADVFAGLFLMPNKLFAAEWHKDMGFSFVERVLRVKRRFKVSYKTVLVRLAEQGFSSYQDLFFKFNAGFKKAFGRDLKDHFEPESVSSGFKGDEPASSLNNLDFMEERFKRFVRMAFERELITTSKAADMLGISLSEMRERGTSWSETP